MMDLMRPWNTLWFAAVVMALGLWAGGASAQADDGGWFDSESGSTGPSERPVLKIHGAGPYDPPPADFQSEPAAPVYDDGEAGSPPEADEVVDEATEAEGQREAVREFSPHLAPYGRWVDDPYYGRIWVPARTVVGRDFAPYVSAGHWELTVNDDWLWVSDYPFGWVTFHYGHWVWGSGYGWGWVPGYRYAPAWVDFRIGATGYVGWGPAAPYYVWRNGVFVSLGWRRPLPYVFCPTAYVFAPSLHRHVIRDRHRVRSIGAQTYRYRPQRVAGVYARSPRLVEAGIPSRAVPTRRIVARPRVGDSQGNLLSSGSLRAGAPRSAGSLRAGSERRASQREQSRLRRDSVFQSAQPARRAPTAGRPNASERFDSRGADFRSARPGVAPAVRPRAPSLDERNLWRDDSVRRAGTTRRAGVVRRGADPRRSTAIPQSKLRPSNSTRRAPPGWVDGARSEPRVAAPRARAPASVPAAPRAAPSEPARVKGTERQSEARGSRRSSGRASGARPSPKARPRTERGSSR